MKINPRLCRFACLMNFGATLAVMWAPGRFVKLRIPRFIWRHFDINPETVFADRVNGRLTGRD